MSKRATHVEAGITRSTWTTYRGADACSCGERASFQRCEKAGARIYCERCMWDTRHAEWDRFARESIRAMGAKLERTKRRKTAK